MIVTNQPVIARGDLTKKGLKDIHDYIEWQLGKQNTFIDEFIIVIIPIKDLKVKSLN